jgi:hypothetical protein
MLLNVRLVDASPTEGLLVSMWSQRVKGRLRVAVHQHREKVALMRFFAFRGRRQSDDSSEVWKKSSLSSYNTNCVEVAGLSGDTIKVRDSKNPRGGVLNFTVGVWDAFVGGVRSGEFDRNPGGL